MTTDARLQPLLSRFHPPWPAWIEVGAGWHNIVIELDQQLARIDPAYTVHQVKEKFGGLRYYCSIEAEPDAHALINKAEQKSTVTCDVCGQRGIRKECNRWLSTRCSEHEARP